MTPRNRSARRTGNSNENSQSTSTPTQNSQSNVGASDAYMAAIQTVLAKLDEVKDDVKKNTANITEQVSQISQVQATARKNTEEIQKLRQELENQRNNPSLQMI